MFIEAVEGTVSNNQIARKHRFLLQREEAVLQLKKSGAESIVINTAKGSDGGASHDPANAGMLQTNPSPLMVAAVTQVVRSAADSIAETFSVAGGGGCVSSRGMTAAAGKISNAIQANPAVFIGVTRLKSKDETTFVHSVSVSGLMILFSNYLGLNKETVNLLVFAACSTI